MLMWIMRCTRPDIAAAVSSLASKIHRFSDAACEQLLRCVGHVERTCACGIVMRLGAGAEGRGLLVHTDAYWRRPRSQMGYQAFVSKNRHFGEDDHCLIDFGSKGQKIGADSTPAAGAIGVHFGLRSVLAVTDAVSEIAGCDEKAPVLTLLNDNKSAAGAYHRGCSEKLSSYNKAVGLKLRFVRDIADLGMIGIGRVDTLHDTADGHTKILERLKSIGSRRMMGVAEMR